MHTALKLYSDLLERGFLDVLPFGFSQFLLYIRKCRASLSKMRRKKVSSKKKYNTKKMHNFMFKYSELAPNEKNKTLFNGKNSKTIFSTI